MNHLDIERADFYQRHLDQVSRSFAFCIRQLREPLKGRVALAYLLCRVLDTIEDSHYPDNRVKFQQIEEFNSFLHELPSPERIRGWLAFLPSAMREAERELMNDARVLFTDFHALPVEQKRPLQDMILSMSNGMVHFLRRTNGGLELRLESNVELNRYCFFVAGVVGELLSRLVASMNPSFGLGAGQLLRSHQFGLFLQKINILKDHLEDEQAGRRLVPSVAELWRSLASDMDGAFQYLLEIPVEEKEYRLFCGWSFFLGLASVPWIKRTWTRRVMDKIPRAVTEQVLGEVTAKIGDNEALSRLYEKMRVAVDSESGRRDGREASGASSGMGARAMVAAKGMDLSAASGAGAVSSALAGDLSAVAGEPGVRPAAGALALSDVDFVDEFPEFEYLYYGKVSREHLAALGMV